MKNLTRNIAVVLAILFLLPVTALAVPTVVGTTIDNTASVVYNDGFNNFSGFSAASTITVDELIDATNVNAGTVTGQPLGVYSSTPYRVTTFGNGSTVFDLSTVTGGAFAVGAISLYADLDDDGDYSNDGGPHTAVTLASYSSFVDVVAVVTIPGGATDGQTGTLQLTAQAQGTFTGGYVQGGFETGGGDGGTVAVLGTTAGSASSLASFTISQVTLSIFKNYSVGDVLGVGTYPVPGNTITYFINISGAGSGYASSVVVSDVLPAGVTYLGGVTITPNAGGDAGAEAAGTVTVNFGNYSGAWGSQRISFPVTITP